MKHYSRKVLLYIMLIILIIISVSFATYAYFQATDTKTFSGDSYNADFSISATSEYQATKLIPVSSSIITKAVNKSTNKCRDDNNRDVCSLYKLSVTNNSIAITLSGFVKTINSTYTTDNLKYQVFSLSGSTYTAVTDVLTVTNTSGNSVYFKKNNANYNTVLAENGSITYYIAFWIEEIEGEQNADQLKTITCKFGFEGINGANLTADFDI